MFICNLKLNAGKISKTFFIIIIIVVLILCGVIGYKIFINPSSGSKVNDKTIFNEVNSLTNLNYTNVLNEVHNNLNSYIGVKIKFTGFVYRVYDLTENQFVLGRNMVISSDFQTVVVGFLCNSSDAKKYTDNAWVEIEGEIKKGNYHGEIPIIEVTNIKEVTKPVDEYVYPPDNTFIPTSNLL